MLFIQRNTLAHALTADERLRLLDLLAGRGLNPLLRSARRHRFASLVAGLGDAASVASAVEGLERECAARQEAAGVAYTPGELFCEGDCILSLVFDAGVSAGAVYSVHTADPLARLARFCRDVREAITQLVEDGGGAAAPPEWEPHAARAPQGLARFIAAQPTDLVRASGALRGGRELARASALMSERPVRAFLRRVQEMRGEGYSARRLFAEADAAGGVSLEKMFDAGLLEREVRVSCRKSGHALFDLPTPDSLAAITLSRAKCSLCAAPVADEVIEETINPTPLAVSLLEDGSWLNNRVYKIIRSLGVPDSEIATGPPSPHGESRLAVDVCGNSFLFVTKDGDLTPAFSRRIGEGIEETEATHLVVVITGSAEDEGRLRLYEFAWRRARGGHDLDVTLAEGPGAAREEIERAFERAIHRELSRHLFTLDAALGLSASDFVLDWFKLLDDERAPSRAAGALRPLFPDLNQRAAS